MAGGAFPLFFMSGLVLITRSEIHISYITGSLDAHFGCMLGYFRALFFPSVLYTKFGSCISH